MTIDQRRPRFLLMLRVAAVLQLSAVLLQATFAGELLSGVAWGRTAHGAGALAVHLTAGLLVVAAVLYWRPGRGPGWPAIAALVLLLGGLAQSGVGDAGTLIVHVPLGVGVGIGAAWLTAWSFTGSGARDKQALSAG